MNNFAKLVTDFFIVHLKQHRNASKNTISSYRDAFKLLFKYSIEVRGISVERLTIDILTPEFVKGFLDWIEAERNCCIMTRNQRLAAIHSFFRYAQGEVPEGLCQFQQIMSIPVKKTQSRIVEHISAEAVQLILEQPNKHSKEL